MRNILVEREGAHDKSSPRGLSFVITPLYLSYLRLAHLFSRFHDACHREMPINFDDIGDTAARDENLRCKYEQHAYGFNQLFIIHLI